MNNQQVEQFQRVLESLHDETLASITRVERQGRALGEDFPHDAGESSVNNFSREFLFHQGTQRPQVVRNIQDALARMRTGTFGECARCGDEIQAKRLRAMPFTAYCRSCQEAIERDVVPQDHKAIVLTLSPKL